MFGSYIDNNENQSSLVDNGSEIEPLNESFAHERGIKIHELNNKDRVRLILGDGTPSQILSKGVYVDLKIGDHREKLFCYVANMDCTLILGDGWLQTHNPIIDWKLRTMRFKNDCVKLGCIVRNTVISSVIKPEHSSSDEFKGKCDFDIQSLSPKRFMKLMKRPDSQITCFYPKNKFSRKLDRYQRKILSLLNAINLEDHEKFAKEKPQYSIDELKERVPEFYHSEIEMFLRKKADELPPHRKEDHQISLISEVEPPFVRNYKPMSEKELTAVKHDLDEHLKNGFIRPSSSEAAASVLLVKKPGGGLRFCVDYRALNAITVKIRYPIPLINETLAKLARAKKFTKLDVIHTFNRMRVREGDEWLTAFNTRYGQFEYLVMPFGLCNAPSTFQSYINNSLQEYPDHFATAYLNDVLVYSETEEEHQEQVLKILKKLRERGLQLDIDKCEFSVSEVKYLGIYVGVNGIRMDPEKIEAILN